MPFRNVVGHRRLVSLLSRGLARDSMPPSLLLAGPEGVGKRRVAMAIAEALNCLKPRTLPAEAGSYTEEEAGSATTEPRNTGTSEARNPIDACGECAVCRRIARGTYPDVITLEPDDTGSIKIEPVRDVIDRAGYRPFEGRRRVVIVDDAEAMKPAAQSALLKTLEEPPSASVFLLVSSMPDLLLPTVRSRCPRLRFGRLDAAEVAGALIRDHRYPDTEAHAAAADADGSLGRALRSRSADVAEARATAQRVLEETARLGDYARRLDLAKDLAVKKGTPAAEREQFAVLLRALSSLLRDLGILSTRADARMLANADLQTDLERLTPAYDSRRSQRAFAAVDRALGALERNASPKIVADWLVLQL